MFFVYLIVFFVSAALIVGGTAELFGGPGAAIGLGAALFILAFNGMRENKLE